MEHSIYPVTMEQLLIQAVACQASDLHMVVGQAPSNRCFGKITQEDLPKLTPHSIQHLLYSLLNENQIKTLEQDWELDFSYAVAGHARFRGNIIYQRGTLAAVFRVIPFFVPSLKEVAPNPDIARLCTLTRGLVLVTGPTGSGKSTLLSAMINEINQTRNANVITIEDPIEFLYQHDKSLIRQREVGTDTKSFAKALRQSLRHDPDVIMIGEMRDLESISIALTAAETGHLVLSTMHTQNAPLTINRIIDSFSPQEKEQVRQQISGSLRAVISQQLIPTVDGKRVAAHEYMVETPAIKSMIRDGNEHQLYSSIQTGKDKHMQTMDQSLADLFLAGKISYDSMLQYCINPKEVVSLTQIGF